MNNRNVARSQGTNSHSTMQQAQAASGLASRWQRQGRWQSTTPLGGLFVLLLILVTAALLLPGCPGSNDDDTFVDITDVRTKDFVAVMPIVNGKDVIFQNTLMGAVGPATLSVRNVTTCTNAANCQGDFTLSGGDGTSGEGDSGGATSCFFLFQDADIQTIGTRINCLTCDLEVVGDCKVKKKDTVCQVRWLLAGVADVPSTAAVVSDPFNVTFTLDDDDNVVTMIDGQPVVFFVE